MVANMKKRIVIFIVLALFILTIGISIDKINANSGEPGTISDPLVTKGYVDQLFESIKGSGGSSQADLTEIYQYIDKKIGSQSSGGANLSEGYVVIDLAPGSKLIGDSSCEIIVRSGETKVIGNELGDGIPNVTEGTNIKDGEIVPNNHLLIIPRTDGRGLYIEKKSFVMVRGNYTIK